MSSKLQKQQQQYENVILFEGSLSKNSIGVHTNNTHARGACFDRKSDIKRNKRSITLDNGYKEKGFGDVSENIDREIG